MWYPVVAFRMPLDPAGGVHYLVRSRINKQHERKPVVLATYPLKIPNVQDNGKHVMCSFKLLVSVLEHIACSRSSAHLAIGSLAVKIAHGQQPVKQCIDCIDLLSRNAAITANTLASNAFPS